MNQSGGTLTPEVAYAMSETALKSVLYSYFAMFKPGILLETTKKLGLGISYFRIPQNYITIQDRLEKAAELPVFNLTSIYTKPLNSTSAFVYKKLDTADGYIDEFRVNIETIDHVEHSVENCCVERRKKFIAFAEERAENPKLAENNEMRFPIIALYHTLNTFEGLRVVNAEELETIHMRLNEREGYIYLVDELFPEYVHPIIIIPTITLIE
jgi:hypothetical protein